MIKKEDLKNFVIKWRDEIIDDACERYQAIDQSHYEKISYTDQVERITKMVDAFIQSLETNSEQAFLDFIHVTGIKRLRRQVP